MQISGWALKPHFEVGHSPNGDCNGRCLWANQTRIDIKTKIAVQQILVGTDKLAQVSRTDLFLSLDQILDVYRYTRRFFERFNGRQVRMPQSSLSMGTTMSSPLIPWISG